jgi:DNA-binding transcriptional LysR family regulator
MFENYRYFLTLAEELNITRASEKLYVTHQCLSRYLSKLEKECGVQLFYRKPKFELTDNGKIFLKTLRQIEFMEINLKQHFSDTLMGNSGCIRIGTTEGRFRIFMPTLIAKFKSEYPDVDLKVTSANAVELYNLLVNNKLEFIIIGKPQKTASFIQSTTILKEKLYVVISDGMLKKYFPSSYPKCINIFKDGVDLRDWEHVPFAFNIPTANSSQMLNELINRDNLRIHKAHVSNYPDLHHVLTTKNYVASFCLTMYLPNLARINAETKNKLYLFPIKNLTETNPVVVQYHKDKEFPIYEKRLLELIKAQGKFYENYHYEE